MDPTRSYRLPKQRVWVARKHAQRKDPRSGRVRTVNRFVVRWTEESRVRERAFDAQLDAHRFLAAKTDELRGIGRVATSSGTTFREWKDYYLGSRFPEYLPYLRKETGRPRLAYLCNLIDAAAVFERKTGGDRPLSDYRPLDFERFRNLCALEGAWSPVTIEGFLARLRTIFNAAEMNGTLDRAPRIKLRAHKTRKRPLPQEEIRQILEVARSWPAENHARSGGESGRLYPILAALYYTAMRRGELIHLRWEDIERLPDGSRRIWIRAKEWKELLPDGGKRLLRWNVKDHETRIVGVHPRLAEILDDLERTRAPSGWVFVNGAGERWTEMSLASLLQRFHRATGAPGGTHVWRHSSLTSVAEATGDFRKVQALAGHADPRTTMNYIHAKDDHASVVNFLPNL